MSEQTGATLLERRLKLGLERTPVASKAGISVAQLATIEQGGTRDKVVARIPAVDTVLAEFETNGVPEGANARRGRRKSSEAAADAGSGEEGDPAPAHVETRPDDAEPGVQLPPHDLPPIAEPGAVGRWEVWGEFKKGDPVATTAYNGAAFEFVAYVQPLSGKPYVDVWGGKRGHEQLKAVPPDSVRKVKGSGPSRKYEESLDFKPNKAKHKA